MISLFSTVLSAAVTFIIFVLRSFFSMLLVFAKAFFKGLKFFFCALPVTATAFIFLFIANIYLMVAGIPAIDIPSEYSSLLSKDIAVSARLFSDLRIWYALNIYPYRGSLVFLLLIALTVILAVPVITVILCIGVFLSFGQLLFYAVAIDVIIYMLRAIFHKSFVAQFLDRYYRLFPDKGKRHYEKNYEKWLRKHHKEFEDNEEEYDDEYDNPVNRRNRHIEEFYEDDDYDDEEFYEDDEYDNDVYDSPVNKRKRRIEEFYEDEDYDSSVNRRNRRINDFYEDDVDDTDDEEFYEDDEDFDDEDIEIDSPATAKTFDFFAGCKSRDSVDKKYKSLVKLYHPDNLDGDTAALQEINVQYTEAKKRFAE